MLIRDYCIYCISPAVLTLPSTYFISKVLVSWETFLAEIVIAIFPSLRRSFMFPSYPGNKPSVMGGWSCISLNTMRLHLLFIAGCPGSRSHSQEADCFGAKCFLQEVTGKGGDFSGNLVQSQLRCVNHTGIRTCPPPSTEQSLQAILLQALPVHSIQWL